MSLFKDQALLKIKLDTGYDLSTATVKKILYKKPDGTKGNWTANHVGTELEYQVEAGDIDQTGDWILQSYIEVSGLPGFGELVKMTISQTLN